MMTLDGQAVGSVGRRVAGARTCVMSCLKPDLSLGEGPDAAKTIRTFAKAQVRLRIEDLDGFSGKF